MLRISISFERYNDIRIIDENVDNRASSTYDRKHRFARHGSRKEDVES